MSYYIIGNINSAVAGDNFCRASFRDVVQNLEAARRPQGLRMDSAQAERMLMERIYDRCHRTMVGAVAASGLPAEFLAAVTANESGGNAEAICFEPGVYEQLRSVASGQAPAFGSIAWKDLSSALQQGSEARFEEARRWFLCGGAPPETLRTITGLEEKTLRELSTSWGYTQIMGYQTVGRKAAVHDLIDPQFHYHLAVDLFSDFARRFRLSLSRDFEALFCCWNTGHPEGKTFDPDYVLKGMRRMNLYRVIVQGAEHAEPAHAAWPIA